VTVNRSRRADEKNKLLYDDETLVHTVELPPFAIGRFPVTNAEWKLFMEAGGYKDERWWDTAAAQAWRRGESTVEGPKQQWWEDRQYLQQHFNEIREYLREPHSPYRTYWSFSGR
jgi:formylglycine-generating enzyme required for sulfatase activity